MMIKWSQASSIAFHAMAALARNNASKTVSAQSLAEEFDVSADHLAKVMQRLSKRGLVKASRGPHGGYMIAVPAEELSMLDIYECIEGPYGPTECVFHAKKCSGESCIFGSMIADLDTVMSGYMKKTKLADVI